VVRLILLFGGVLNLRKLQVGRKIEIIGIDVDSAAMMYSIGERRWDRLQAILLDIVKEDKQPVRVLARATGMLISMMAAVRHARTLLWAIFFLIIPYGQAHQWNKRIRIPPLIKRRCQWWLDHFEGLNGIPIHDLPDAGLDVDAAKVGSGGFLYASDVIALAHQDHPACERDLHNNVLELLAVVDAVLALVDKLKGRRIVIRSDNAFTVSYLRRGGGPNPICTTLVQAFLDFLIETGIELVRVEHVAGCVNIVADGLSRLQDFHGDWMIKPTVLKSVQQWIEVNDLPMFTLDAFASSLNHVVPHFCSRYHEVNATYVNAFTAPIEANEWVLWCNPPFSLLARVLLWLRQGRYTAYVVAPRWVGQPWWLPLVTMSRATYQLPRDAFTSVVRAHEEGYHAVEYEIDVHFCPHLLP